MLLATTQVEDFDRFLEVFSNGGAEKRKLQAHYQNIEESWDAAVAGFKSAVALFRNAGLPSGDWLPYRYLLFPPAIAAARGHALDER